jgi:hypothetical protein
MRRLLRISFVIVVALAWPRQSAALLLTFDATLTLDQFPGVSIPPFAGGELGVTAVALDPSGVIQRIDFPAQVFETTGAAFPANDPAVPPIGGVVVTLSNDAGVFQRGPDGFGGSMPLHGSARICLFGTCQSAGGNLEIPLSVVGRDAPAVTAYSLGLALTVSGAPWTTGSISLAPGPNGTPRLVSGSDQGAELNLVTPIFVSTNIPAYRSLRPYARLVALFFPEPDGYDCSNGFDDDGDGSADFPADPGCDSAEDSTERNPGAPCDDGLDNDGDVRIDAADPGCESPLDGTERAATLACDDGFDNDGDATIDFPGDRGCANAADLSESGVLACDNGFDDDGDALIDVQQDPGCDAPGDLHEAFDFTDGAAHRIDLAHPSPDNAAFVGPDADGVSSALRLDTGGALAGTVSVAGSSYLQMSGGTIGGDLVALDQAQVSMWGGAIEGQLEAGGSSVIEITGSSFDLPFGDVLLSSGTIVGSLLDGTAISLPFTRAAGATIRLVPEADASLAAAVAFAALVGVRTLRSRRRGAA